MAAQHLAGSAVGPAEPVQHAAVLAVALPGSGGDGRAGPIATTAGSRAILRRIHRKLLKTSISEYSYFVLRYNLIVDSMATIMKGR
jgi:hypothetical protein